MVRAGAGAAQKWTGSATLPPIIWCAQVRVCDSCFDKYGPKETAATAGAAATAATAASSLLSSKEADLPAEYLASPLSKQSQVNFLIISYFHQCGQNSILGS
jgi:hypothetical protein